MKVNKRNIHRDLGYFYFGLIISFACSGILMNHRDQFHAEKYTLETKKIEVKLPEEDKITEDFAKDFGKSLGIDDTFRKHRVSDEEFKISFKNTDVEIDLKTGKGEVVSFVKTPIISQMMKLHKSTSNWWIYYSDIFGISLITIAITGAIMITHGKNTFARRGWKLALAGIIIPLLVLIFVG